MNTTNEELSKIINSIFTHANEGSINIGTLTIDFDFNTNEEVALFLGVISNLEKMNIDGIAETERYTKYLLSDNRYTEPDAPQS